MKKIMMTMLGMAALPLFANTPPEITNVRASQRENTKLVDIYYDAADADGDLLKVRIEISDNDGLKYSVPAFSLTGDIGEGVAAGTNKHIAWDAGTDWDGEYSDKMRVKVYAIDAQGFPGLEWGNEVPPGGFLMGQDGGAEGSGPSRHVNIPWSYWLSKYEITCQQYCDFLNAAKASGFTTGASIKSGSVPELQSEGSMITLGDSYRIRWNVNKYEVVVGMTNYPVSVTYLGALAFARYYGYDLPTEAEWEKAARGPDNDDQDEHLCYPWGDDISASYASYGNDGVKQVGYYDGSQVPVGPDTVNGYDLYDVIGNEPEWTRTYGASSTAAYPNEESLTNQIHESIMVCSNYSWPSLAVRGLRNASDVMLYKRSSVAANGTAGFRVARRSVNGVYNAKLEATVDFSDVEEGTAIGGYLSPCGTFIWTTTEDYASCMKLQEDSGVWVKGGKLCLSVDGLKGALQYIRFSANGNNKSYTGVTLKSTMSDGAVVSKTLAPVPDVLYADPAAVSYELTFFATNYSALTLNNIRFYTTSK